MLKLSGTNRQRAATFRTVKCQECDHPFNINNDSINTGHEMLLLDCYAFIERKQYMQCVLNVAQAYEVFFSRFLHVQLIYRAFASHGSRDLLGLNRAIKQLYDRVQRLSFEDMRRLVLKLVIDNVAPASLADAEAAIAALPKNPPEVPAQVIEAMPDGRLKALLLLLAGTKTNKLRNQVVHKDAYRPTLDEAKHAHNEAREILHGLTASLGLGYDINWHVSQVGR